MLDVYRRNVICRGDIYYIDLDEYPFEPNNEKVNDDNQQRQKYMPTSGLIGKSRPCVIISDSEYNESAFGARIIPIKSVNESGAKQYNDVVVQIEFDNGIHNAIINQSRFVSRKRIKQYLGTLVNKKLDEIDRKILEVDTGLSAEDIEALQRMKNKYKK